MIKASAIGGDAIEVARRNGNRVTHRSRQSNALSDNPLFGFYDLQNVVRRHAELPAHIGDIRPLHTTCRFLVRTTCQPSTRASAITKGSAEVRSFRSPTRRGNCESTCAASTCTASSSSRNIALRAFSHECSSSDRFLASCRTSMGAISLRALIRASILFQNDGKFWRGSVLATQL